MCPDLFSGGAPVVRFSQATSCPWACVRLSKRRPAFVDDEIQGGLPYHLIFTFWVVA